MKKLVGNSSNLFLLRLISCSNNGNEIEESINIDFLEDNYFAELKEFEIMRERLEMAQQMEDLVGKYVSNEYVRRVVLKQSDEDIDQLDKQIEKEKAEGGDEEDSDMDFESTEIAPINDIHEIEEESEQHKEELHEAQLKMIQSMTKVLED